LFVPPEFIALSRLSRLESSRSGFFVGKECEE